MTKAQRSAKAKRAGAKRRKANAAAAFLRRMNPGKKLPAAVRVKRLKDGGISVTPIKLNRGGLRRLVSEYKHQRKGGSSVLGSIRKARRSVSRNRGRSR